MDTEIKKEVKKLSAKYIVMIVIGIILVLAVGTFAWLSYRTNDTAMVLTIGDINNVQLTLKPYRIESTFSPTNSYTSENYVSVSAVNNSTSERKIRLFYKINSIDSLLKQSTDFQYTITRKAPSDSNYQHVVTGNFTSASAGSEFTIYEDTIPGNNTTYLYRVYVWLHTNGDQTGLSGKKFDAELNASIADIQYLVTFDPNGGEVTTTSKVVTVGSTYGTLPTPTRSGYTFKGWNGKNLFNKDDSAYKPLHYIKGSDNSEVSLGEYSIYQISVMPNTTYVITNSGQSTAPGYVIYNSSGNKVAGANYANTAAVIFTTPSTASYMRFSVVTYSGSTRYDKLTFQIEEGSSATTYEPYYVTSNTTVTQEKNHTLTAIWEPVS